VTTSSSSSSPTKEMSSLSSSIPKPKRSVYRQTLIYIDSVAVRGDLVASWLHIKWGLSGAVLELFSTGIYAGKNHSGFATVVIR
jgi:hypothetical protein